MKKTFTKESLAVKLNGCEYRDVFSEELWELAKHNRLVVIHGASDDLVLLSGAIDDEADAYDGGTVMLCRTGIPRNRCEDENCPYNAENLKEALKYEAVRVIKVYWCGKCNQEKMDAVKYAALGKPTWCYDTSIPHATFDMFDTSGDEREYYCRGIIIDLDEAWPRKSSTATKLDAAVVH